MHWLRIRGKGKTKVMKESNNDDKDETTCKLQQELEDFVVLPTLDDKQLAMLLLPPSEFFEKNGKLLGSFVLEGFKSKRKSKAIVAETTGTKHAFKSRKTVNSDSDKEEKERAHVIKKIKHELIDELVEKGKGKKVEKIQMMVVPKVLVAGPPCSTPSKPVVLISTSTSKSIVKVSITPSTAPMTPVKSVVPVKAPTFTVAPATKPAEQVTVTKDSFMLRHFKLAGTEENGALIINQATEVSAERVVGTQTQVQEISDESSNDKSAGKDNKDGQGKDESMVMNVEVEFLNIDADFLESLHLEEMLQVSSSKKIVKVIED
ncbi:hypothetical protein C0995_012524, partial [Termitomyces sp. Mi166